MVTITYLPEFLKQAKRLAGKYPSFPEDLKTFVEEIKENPLAGVITFNYAVNDDNREVTLMTVYDKSDRENISNKEIVDLRKTVLGSK